MYKVRAKLLGTDDYYNFEVEEDATYQNIVHIVAIKLNKKENNLFVTVDKEKKNKYKNIWAWKIYCHISNPVTVIERVKLIINIIFAYN